MKQLLLIGIIVLPLMGCSASVGVPKQTTSTTYTSGGTTYTSGMTTTVTKRTY